MSTGVEIDEDAIEPVVEVWPKVIKLKHPVQFAGETISVLEMRRGRLGDLKGLKLRGEMPIEHIMLIASRLSGRELKVIEMLDAEDGGEVMDIASDFLMLSLKTGRTG